MTNELAIRILTGDVLGTSEQTHEAIKMAVKALSLSSAPRWIPVTEQLPEENGRYLVSGGLQGSRQIWICKYMIFANVRGWINDVSNPAIIAWQPLPEPYREETENGNS